MPSTAQEAVERKDDIWGPTEVCYDGITYLYVTVHGGYALTLKIDSETLQPIRCEND